MLVDRTEFSWCEKKKKTRSAGTYHDASSSTLPTEPNAAQCGTQSQQMGKRDTGNTQPLTHSGTVYRATLHDRYQTCRFMYVPTTPFLKTPSILSKMQLGSCMLYGCIVLNTSSTSA